MTGARLSLRSMFTLQRIVDVLDKSATLASTLAFVGQGKTRAIGIGAQLATLALAFSKRDLDEITRDWSALDQPQEFHRLFRRLLRPTIRRRVNDWTHYEVPTATQRATATPTPAAAPALNVLSLMSADAHFGAYHVEHGVDDLTAWLREAAWREHSSLSLVPVGRWCESVDLRATHACAPVESVRAREIWARIAHITTGGTRSVMLAGRPRTGKSTIARQLVVLLEAAVAHKEQCARPSPVRVLTVDVADFKFLTPSIVAAAVTLLQPRIVILDDIDRFQDLDQLLGCFERIRGPGRLIITTCNAAKKLPVALRLFGRIDEWQEVGCAGAELAEELMHPFWSVLAKDQGLQVASWPVAAINELRERMLNLTTQVSDQVLGQEIRDIQRRVDESDDGDSGPLPIPPKEKP